jgi:hypothetical protein
MGELPAYAVDMGSCAGYEAGLPRRIISPERADAHSAPTISHGFCGFPEEAIQDRVAGMDASCTKKR